MEWHRPYEGIRMSKRCRDTWWDEQIIHQCLDWPHSIFTLPAKTFVVEVILVDTNNVIKGPAIEFGKLLRFIGIWLLMASNPVRNWADYFSKNPIFIFSGFSIRVNQFMSVNDFESICSALKCTNTPPPSIPIKKFCMNYSRWLIHGTVTCKEYLYHIGYNV